MTPAERALLIAIAEVIGANLYGMKIRHCIEDVRKEDRSRPEAERMRQETFDEYRERISR